MTLGSLVNIVTVLVTGDCHARAKIVTGGEDDFDILAAIWILSCNDENPLLTYQGISARLNVPDGAYVRELVASRRELFRPGAPHVRLRAWKQRMKAGHGRPSWITDLEDAAEQVRIIDGLSEQDVFRNQFRAAACAPRASLELVDWGLSHIERLRTSRREEREARTKKWATIFVPVLSIGLALVSLAATAGIQLKSIDAQAVLKQYEVGFRPIQDAYTRFMTAISEARTSVAAQDGENTARLLSQADQTTYLFEPFLADGIRRDIKQQFSEFTNLVTQAAQPNRDDAARRDLMQRIEAGRTRLSARLYDGLFGGAGRQ